VKPDRKGEVVRVRLDDALWQSRLEHAIRQPVLLAVRLAQWPDPDGMTGASHRRPIVHQRTCRRNRHRHRALPLEQQRNSCPYRPVGREAFRSAASREMSLMSAIPYPKRSRTGFEKAE
jgi:hypothetical protein